jgi:hypothetical protein
MKNRTTASCSKVLQAALAMVKPAHVTIMAGSQMRGLTFWIMMLLGIWPTSMLQKDVSTYFSIEMHVYIPRRSHRKKNIVLVAHQVQLFSETGDLRTRGKFGCR